MALMNPNQFKGLFTKPITNFGGQNAIGLPSYQGLFEPEPLRINQEPINDNPPIEPPAGRLLPSLMTKPPNLGASNYPDIEAYRGILRKQPKREEHQLNKWGKLLAGAAGTIEGYQRGIQPGIETGLGLMDRPYNQALEDWKSKASGAGELANLEVKLDEIDRKRTEDAYKMMYDYNKNIIDWEEAKTRLKLSEAQIRNYDSMVLNRDAEYREIDGKPYLLIRQDQGVVLQPIGGGLLGETKAEGRAADFENDKAKLNIQLDNALELERERQKGDIASIERQQGVQESLARLRVDLAREMMGSGIGGVDLETYGKAWDLAVGQVQDMNPELINQLYNPDGSLKGADANGIIPEDKKKLMRNYQDAIRKRVQELLGWDQGSNTPKSGWPAQNIPITGRPQSSQNESNITSQAIEAIRMMYPNQPQLQTDSRALNRVKDAIRKDPEYLNKLREELEIEQQKANPSATPNVTLPQQPVMAPQGIFLQVPGRLPRNNPPMLNDTAMRALQFTGALENPQIQFPLTNSERRRFLR